MAKIRIQEENREIRHSEEIRTFLDGQGIRYEQWEVDGRVGPDAANDEILEAYSPEIDRLKEEGGFVTADVINVTPDTPGLDAMLAKFTTEHTHSEDEVRFTVKGRGLFHIHPEVGPVFAIEVEKGDLISVPAGTRHWFDLCGDRTIQCIRLFEDMSGWTPHYVDDPVHQNYMPVCLGPAFVAGSSTIDSPMRI